MEAHPTPNEELHCPTSGQLLGQLVRAFRLTDPAVGGERAARHISDKKARRYFAGEWLGGEQRQDLCGWIAEAFAASGVIGDLRLSSGREPPELRSALASSLYAWLRSWDELYRAEAKRWRASDRALGGFVLARQVVIDLSLRLASGRVLASEYRSAHGEFGPWADDGLAEFLRALLDELLPGATLDQRSATIGVDPRTLDRWISKGEPTVPSEGNVAQLADALAKGDDTLRTSIRVRLRRAIGLHELYCSLARAIGARWAGELGQALESLVDLTLSIVGEGHRSTEELEDLTEMLLKGLAFPASRLMLVDWLRRDPAPLWIDDIVAAKEGRVDKRLNHCLRVIATWHEEPEPDILRHMASSPEDRRCLHETAALMAMRDNRATPEALEAAIRQGKRVVRAPAPNDQVRISNRLLQANACAERGDYDGALPHYARMVALAPRNAKYRFWYGCALWQAKTKGDREQAIYQLEESCQLAPDWDMPFVEIGIMLLNRGLPEMAVAHLERDPANFKTSSAHFNYVLGGGLRGSGRLAEAQECFEQSAELSPQHGEALDLAADCAFRLRDAVRGRRYAKRAYDLGVDRSYRLYRVG